jgi:hypothetical protein
VVDVGQEYDQDKFNLAVYKKTGFHQRPKIKKQSKGWCGHAIDEKGRLIGSKSKKKKSPKRSAPQLYQIGKRVFEWKKSSWLAWELTSKKQTWQRNSEIVLNLLK